jgi:osmoprotectant transport system permease protein
MTFSEYLSNNYQNLIDLSLEHLKLVMTAMLIATAAGLPLGIAAHRSAFFRPLILGTSSFFLTIPSLALFAIFIPVFGLGSPPAVAALTLYAMLPIVGNTVAGLNSVSPAVVKAARGMGLGPWRRLWQVELPLAWPVVVTGLRVSTQVVIGIAAIAVFVGGPGLGNEIFRGIRSLGNPGAENLVYGGTIAIVILALLFDGFFVLVRRLTTPRGIR